MDREEMYKSKSRSQQRGSQKKRRPPYRDEYKETRIVFSKHERMHLGLDREGQEQFLSEIKEVLITLAKNGIRKPRDVATTLNRMSIKTAIGQKWTPRLAHMLLGEVWSDNKTGRRG